MSVVPEASMQDLTRAVGEGSTVVDVREYGEYVEGHVPGARLVPLGELPDRLAEIDGSGRVYVVCASGRRSRLATEVLCAAGYDAVSVAGGTAGWQQAGREVVTGDRPAD